MRQLIQKSAVALAGMALIALAACSGGGGSHGAIPSTGTQSHIPNYTGPAALADFEWGKSMVAQAQYIGPVTGNPEMVAHVVPTLQNARGLATYAQEVNDPRSALFRRFITPQQIGQEYGASNANLKTLVAYLGGSGLKVSYWPQKLMLNVEGPMTSFEHAFNTEYGMYQTVTGEQFVAPVSAPHTTVAVPISAVVGMVQAKVQHTEIVSGAGESQGFGYTPQQVAHAFTMRQAWNEGYSGSGVTAGIIGTGPIATTQNESLGSTDFTNFKLYTNTAPAMAPEQIMYVSAIPASATNDNTGTTPYDPLGGANLWSPPPPTLGGSCGTPGGQLANYQACNPEDVEAQLDTEQVASLAPGASDVDFYLAYERTCYDETSGMYATPDPEPTGTTCPGGYEIYDLEGIDLTDDEIQQAISDNVVDTVSMSFGEGENVACEFGYFGTVTSSSGNSATCPDASTGLGPLEIAALSAEGIAVFISTGDEANSECENFDTGSFISGYCLSYPGSDPNAVGAGGVNVGLDNEGNILNEITDWGYETDRGSVEGAGGGFSQYFTVPTFQNTVGTSIPYASAASTGPGTNPAWGSGRGLPDVDMIADPTTGVLVVFNEDGEFVGGAEGGTSVSAPELNGEWVDVLSACKSTAACERASGPHPWRLGNPNAYYYAMASNSANYGTNCTNGTSTSCGIYDVLYGNNVDKPSGGSLQTLCCYAGTGWDPATGLGVPFAANLITQVLAIADSP